MIITYKLVIFLIIVFVLTKYSAEFDAFLVRLSGSRKIILNLSVITILLAFILSIVSSFITFKKSKLKFIISLLLLLLSIVLLLDYLII